MAKDNEAKINWAEGVTGSTRTRGSKDQTLPCEEQ
jgi:hypothetical protein